MQAECLLEDSTIMWGLLEFTSDFETIEAMSRLCSNKQIMYSTLSALAPGGYTLSFGGPRADVSLIGNRLMNDILQLCTRAEVHSADFKYVCVSFYFLLYLRLGLPNR
jgi:hypothetical protein